jgi:hypothetical protein
MLNMPSSLLESPSSLVLTTLTMLERSMNTVRVGLIKFVMAMMRPCFSTMNNLFVSSGGEVMQTGLEKTRLGNAFVWIYPQLVTAEAEGSETKPPPMHQSKIQNHFGDGFIATTNVIPPARNVK